MKAVLFVALAVLTGIFILAWFLAEKSRREERTPVLPGALETAVGFVTNFFDALGIGAFATCTASFKFWHMVRDEQIPGTLNVGNTMPSILEAFIFIAIVRVEIATLVPILVASMLGAWVGARIISAWPRHRIQIGIGIALLVAAAVALAGQFSLLPTGGDKLGLDGAKLVVAVGIVFMLGALQMLGIGLFAPCLITLSLLGMNPRAVFPIMMGCCAFMMPIGSMPFIHRRSYNLPVSLGITLGGLPGVLLAAFVVKSLRLEALRWLVIFVVVYAAVMLLRTAAQESRSRQASLAAAPGTAD